MNEQLEAIRDALLDSSDIDRVEPYLRDEVSLPCITYELSSDVLELTMSGGALHRSEIDFRCMASTYSGAEDLADAVGAALVDGALSIPSFVRVALDRTYDLPIESSNSLMYNVGVSVAFWWSES